MEVGGGGGKVSFSPLPLLLFIYFYFCSRSTFRALSRAKSLGTQVIINWVDKVLAALHAPRCRVGVSISEDRQLYLQARPPQGGREAVISSASPPRTHSPPPPRHPSPPHQLNTTVALVNNAVQNVSVIKILTCNHPSEDWVVTFLINCLYVSCPPWGNPRQSWTLDSTLWIPDFTR